MGRPQATAILFAIVCGKNVPLQFSWRQGRLRQKVAVIGLRLRALVLSASDALGGSWGGGLGPTPSSSAPLETVLGYGDAFGLYSGQFCLCVWYGVCFSVLVCL